MLPHCTYSVLDAVQLPVCKFSLKTVIVRTGLKLKSFSNMHHPVLVKRHISFPLDTKLTGHMRDKYECPVDHVSGFLKLS